MTSRRDVLSSRVTLATGAALGVLRGLAASTGYALVFCVEKFLLDLFSDDLLHQPTAADLGMGFILFALVANVAATVGAIGGAALGAVLVPVVNRWRGSSRSLALAAAAVFTCAGLAVFPAIPLGGGVSDLEEALMLKMLPAVLAGSAAAWQARSLHRLRTGSMPGA